MCINFHFYFEFTQYNFEISDYKIKTDQLIEDLQNTENVYKENVKIVTSN